ncbi:MAG: GTPase RsgA [Myxococcota bacterium]
MLGLELQPTRPVRDGDDRGRHTTTMRELFLLPSGAILIDTPGMRGAQLWHGDVDDAFADVSELAAGCRFGDCRHEREPGCAVRAAVESGALEAGRLASFRALGRELAYMARREDPRLAAAERSRWKAIHKSMRDR